MVASRTADALQARFGAAVQDVVVFRSEVTAVVDRDSIAYICTFCRDELDYRYLSDISAVDWLDRRPRFDVVYHLVCVSDWSRFRLKVQVDEDEPVPTVTPVWSGANWPEREVWDLFGIVFDPHPQLERLLMPDGWLGHPLRKDYAQTRITLPRPKDEKVLE